MPKPRKTQKPASPESDHPPSQPPSAARWSVRHILLVLGILAVAVGLRLYDVGGKDVWIDEANGVIMSQGTLPELFAPLKLDSSPPLYYIILHGWMKVFGDSELALRGLSILCGVAAVGTVFVIGRRLYSLETGALAAVLVATSPIQIFFSQQGRMYALLALVALLSSYWLWRAVSDGSRRFVVAYGLATLAALYVHNHGLYLLPAHAVVLLWSGALWARPGTWLICGGCVVVGYLPWLPILLAQLENTMQYDWLLPFWRRQGPLGAVKCTLISFAPGGPHPFFRSAIPKEPGWLSPLLFSMVAGLSLVRLVWRSNDGRRAARVGWLLSVVCIPLVSALLASKLVTPNYVPGRCDQLVFPGFVLLVAVGLTVIRPIILRYAVLAAFLVFSVMGLQHHYGNHLPKGDRAMARAIAERARPRDAVLCTSFTRASLQYYLGRLDAPVTFFSYPREMARHLANRDVDAWLANPDKLEQEVRLVEEEIEEQCGPRSRLFVVLVPEAINKVLRDAIFAAGQNTRAELIGEFRQAGTNAPVLIFLRH